MATFTIPKIKRFDTIDAIPITITIDGVPLDISGSKIGMWLQRRTDEKGELLSEEQWEIVKQFDNESNGGITITDGANGQFEISEQRIDVVEGTYYYDIQIKLPDGSKKTYVSGTWTIETGITRMS